MILPVFLLALTVQSSFVSALPSPPETIVLLEEVILDNSTSTNTSTVSRNEKQLAEEDNIDVDGPYGYMPRVVHGVNKIVKGLLEGSPHKIFHGAFGIAPEDVADDLIETYNRIMGIPDPDDLPDSVKRKTTTKPTTVKPNGSNSTAKTENPLKSKGDDLNKKKKNKDDDDDDDEDDDFDDRK